MSLTELESHLTHTEKLDKMGIELLNEIYNDEIFNGLNIDKYIYYSRGIDKSILELN